MTSGEKTELALKAGITEVELDEVENTRTRWCKQGATEGKGLLLAIALKDDDGVLSVFPVRWLEKGPHVFDWMPVRSFLREYEALVG